MQLTETGAAIEILTWMWQVLYTEHQRTLTNVPTTPTDTTSGLTETDKRTRQTLHLCVLYKSGWMISGSRCAIESLNPTIQRAGVASKTTNQFDDESNNKKLTSGHSIRATLQFFFFFVRSGGIVQRVKGDGVGARTSTLPTTVFHSILLPHVTSDNNRQC